jgi:hypothetical protein
MIVVRLYLVVLFVLSAAVYSSAQLWFVPANADSIWNNANAVVRYDSTTLEIKSKDLAFYTTERVVSVLKPGGNAEAVVTVFYDAKDELVDFKAWVYDRYGNEVRQFNKRDAEDYSASDYDEISDSRVKVWKLSAALLPYTIKYCIKQKIGNTYILPRWVPVSNEVIALDYAVFSIKAPQEIATHILASNVVAGPGANTWYVNNFKPVKEKPYSRNIMSVVPQVACMMHEFSLYKNSGSAASWNDIGKFESQLNSGVDDFTEINDPQIDAIIANSTNKHDIINGLYYYLQNNYRYVSIQLGLGGWQPKAAAYTFKKKFGDCKALTVEMKAILKKAGIESNYTLVNTLDSRIEPTDSFVHSHFNHVILCVPLVQDTVWLECTSQLDPPGFLGSFTEDRNALLVYDGGARIIHTPVYTEADNHRCATTDISWQEGGDCLINSHITLTGEMQERLRAVFADREATNIEQALLQQISIPNAHMNGYEGLQVSNLKPELAYGVKFSSQYPVKQIGSRLFVHTNVFNPLRELPDKADAGNLPVKIKQGFVQADTLVFRLPAGLQPENFKATDNYSIESLFGKAVSAVSYNQADGTLTITRNLTLKEATYSPSHYPAFCDFMAKAAKAFCPDLVLKKVQ